MKDQRYSEAVTTLNYIMQTYSKVHIITFSTLQSIKLYQLMFCSFSFYTVEGCAVAAGVLLLSNARLCECCRLLRATDVLKPGGWGLQTLLRAVSLQSMLVRGVDESVLSNRHPRISNKGRITSHANILGICLSICMYMYEYIRSVMVIYISFRLQSYKLPSSMEKRTCLVRRCVLVLVQNCWMCTVVEKNINWVFHLRKSHDLSIFFFRAWSSSCLLTIRTLRSTWDVFSTKSVLQ